MLCDGSLYSSHASENAIHILAKKPAQLSALPHSVTRYFYSTALVFQVRKHQAAPKTEL